MMMDPKQPPNSPDMNANDLGFYRSLEKAVGPRRDFKLDKRWKQVEAAFWAYNEDKLTRIFEQKARVFRAVINVKGSNNFPMPHRRDMARLLDVNLINWTLLISPLCA